MFNTNTIKKYILQIFDLKEEELHKTLLLQLNIFLLITTLLIVKPTINSLFLSELTSDALPLGYVLTALTAIIGSYFYDKILEIKPLNRVIEGTIKGSVISLIILAGTPATIVFGGTFFVTTAPLPTIDMSYFPAQRTYLARSCLLWHSIQLVESC